MLPPATVACAVILGDAAEVPDPGTLAGEMVAIGVALLVVNLWEEGAWAGFLQTPSEGRPGEGQAHEHRDRMPAPERL